MPSAASFESFQFELNRLVESFGRRVTELKQPGYAEAQLRDDFLNPFFRALGWDMEMRSATAESDKATLQNAVTATDQQIDQLAYELYGLTADEIKLVEDHA